MCPEKDSSSVTEMLCHLKPLFLFFLTDFSRRSFPPPPPPASFTMDHPNEVVITHSPHVPTSFTQNNIFSPHSSPIHPFIHKVLGLGGTGFSLRKTVSS
ncbi:hypothetical protein CDAR_556031 [Caerostris darwini]|uniref:Uncharacterized protein n=1 Tax=Caerostris darwini TaxID=1538125 RepID=A0AAV4UVB4_9ARAC|nr:hypothetical protein CDAR_556031 [Caerostris darwini]